LDIHEIKKRFEDQFDLVGIISTKRYLDEAKRLGLQVPFSVYPTMVVLGLSYPKRVISHSKTHLVPSFYTFGSDYHDVLKSRIQSVMKNIPIAYDYGVDNHQHNERLAALLANIGFFGKNQLIINSNYGSYIFLGVVFLDIEIIQEFVLDIDDDCGTCRKCIDACPTSALLDGGYDFQLCISHYNQAKIVLTDDQIKANYALFGCDICQLVCPKNINKGVKTHHEFELSGKELVSIHDLFTLSEKAFKEKYSNMAYLWKGKTILMRNALMLLNRQKNNQYEKEILDSLLKTNVTWYKDMVVRVLKNLEK
jgi:epoxyqueuosine reductase